MYGDCKISGICTYCSYEAHKKQKERQEKEEELEKEQLRIRRGEEQDKATIVLQLRHKDLRKILEFPIFIRNDVEWALTNLYSFLGELNQWMRNSSNDYNYTTIFKITKYDLKKSCPSWILFLISKKYEKEREILRNFLLEMVSILFFIFITIMALKYNDNKLRKAKLQKKLMMKMRMLETHRFILKSL